MDLDQADTEPPLAKKPRHTGGNDHESDADDEDDDGDLQEPDRRRSRLDGGDELDSGYESDVAELFFDGEDDDAEQLSLLIDSLTLSGVDPKVANAKANDLVDPNVATLLEFYGRGSIFREANQSRRDLNVRGFGALDNQRKMTTTPRL